MRHSELQQLAKKYNVPFQRVLPRYKRGFFKTEDLIKPRELKSLEGKTFKEWENYINYQKSDDKYFAPVRAKSLRDFTTRKRKAGWEDKEILKRIFQTYKVN